MRLDRYLDYWGNVRKAELAIVEGERSLSWGDVDRLTSALAFELQRLGVERHARVGCLLHSSADWCLIYFAVLKAGATFVPINAGFGSLELKEIVADAQLSALVSNRGLMRVLADGWGDVPAAADDEQSWIFLPGKDRPGVSLDVAFAASGMPGRASAGDDGDIAVIGYTSGTTGLPKGVMITHDAAASAMINVVLALGYTSADRMLLMAPLAFTGGYLSGLTPVLIVGARIYIEQRPDPQRALDRIANDKVSVIGAVGTVWERIAELPGFATADLSPLKVALAGGMPISAEILARYHARGINLQQGYACTESGGSGCRPSVAMSREKPQSAGPPLPSLELRIVDDDNVPLPAGEIGEIMLRGPQMFSGYWNKPEATREAFKDGWYATGDLGRVDADGCLEVVDRKKSMLISGGVNIYPAEIERTLSHLVSECEIAVIGVADRQWGQRVVALLSTDAAIDIPDLKRRCKDILGIYKSPREFVVTDRPLPRTVTGKTARADLGAFYSAIVGPAS